MTLSEELSAVADLMADARRLGDLYVTTMASYGRTTAGAERVGSRSLKLAAYGLRDDAQDAYAAFYGALGRLAEAGHLPYALDLHASVIRVAGEAQRVALVRACREIGGIN